MLEAFLKFVAAYFLGGVMGGDVMRRLLGGGDLRDTGSGNVGATNALRARGPRFALGVLLIDAGKGVVAALVIPRIPWPGSTDALSFASLEFLCASGVALGHCFPVLHRFRGGKGVATLAGVYGALFPTALPWIAGVFVLVVLVSGFVAIASIGSAVTAVVWVASNVDRPLSMPLIFVAAMLGLVVFKHRGNLANLYAGKEHRFEKARLLGRWVDKWRAR